MASNIDVSEVYGVAFSPTTQIDVSEVYGLVTANLDTFYRWDGTDAVATRLLMWDGTHVYDVEGVVL